MYKSESLLLFLSFPHLRKGVKSMRKPFHALLRVIAMFNLWISGILLVLMVLINTMEIVARKLLNYSFFWVQEATILMAVWMIFLAAAYLFYQKSLLHVDNIIEKLPRRYRFVVKLASSLVIGFTLAFIFKYSFVVNELQSSFSSYALQIPSNLFSLPVMVAVGMMLLTLLSDILEQVVGRGRSDRVDCTDTPH